MRTGRLCLACLASLAAQPHPVRAQAAATTVAPPVIACTSLANLRTVLRGAGDNAAAAVPIVTDPRSDLGCGVLDRASVTGVADHLALNGRAYDCLALQGTSVCHWTVAGAVQPPPAGPAGKVPAGDAGRR